MSGRFLEVGIYPRGIGHGMGFPGFMEVVLQREASRRQVMSFVSKFVAADPALVSQQRNVCIRAAVFVALFIPGL